MIYDDVLEILQSNRYGTIGTDLFLNRFPDQPDDLIGLATLASPVQTLNMPDQEYVFSVMLRGKDYDDAFAKSLAIHKMFSRQILYSKTGRILAIRPASPPYFLEFDELDRAKFVYNFNLYTNED